jgi:hypothetical protein
MRSLHLIKFSILLIFAFTIAACGGSDADPAPLEPPPLTPPPITVPPVEMVNVSGLISEVPLMAANITILNLENKTLAV